MAAEALAAEGFVVAAGPMCIPKFAHFLEGQAS